MPSRGLGTSRRAAAATGHWCLLVCSSPSTQTREQGLDAPPQPRGQRGRGQVQRRPGDQGPAVGTGARHAARWANLPRKASLLCKDLWPLQCLSTRVEERFQNQRPGWPSSRQRRSAIWGTPACETNPPWPRAQPSGCNAVSGCRPSAAYAVRRVTLAHTCRHRWRDFPPPAPCMPVHVWGRNQPSDGGTGLSCGLCQSGGWSGWALLTSPNTRVGGLSPARTSLSLVALSRPVHTGPEGGLAGLVQQQAAGQSLAGPTRPQPLPAHSHRHFHQSSLSSL